MIKMCLNLFNSQFKGIKEVEYILYNQYWKVSEEEIIDMKDNREKIEETIELIQKAQFIDGLGI